ncbi:hypothetical protein F3J27_06035 [Enterobacter sp. Ap-916]|uniref:hypothetical protein n=1 Tax=Enterobacteriaceae TaxID=543 RepID=UPI00141EA8A9|nr:MULTISPECIES: hypothetical protein [unclassified Enterobacter]NIF57016.1 hypothetical protein [Enterobacter sp. Ap-867]NIG29043.1 hypothetical protein [Enterobacter sp. Ap-916]
MNTATIGLLNVLEKITNLGARNSIISKQGNRTFIEFISPNGNVYKVTTRAKTSGTWQTSINYGSICTIDKSDNEFWVFIDLEREPNSFYVTPLFWIRNDIYKAHALFMEKHGGRRPLNDESTHHAISKKRIADWMDRWELLGL